MFGVWVGLAERDDDCAYIDIFMLYRKHMKVVSPCEATLHLLASIPQMLYSLSFMCDSAGLFCSASQAKKVVCESAS